MEPLAICVPIREVFTDQLVTGADRLPRHGLHGANCNVMCITRRKPRNLRRNLRFARQGPHGADRAVEVRGSLGGVAGPGRSFDLVIERSSRVRRGD
jgi:hypothetical protein